MFAAAMDRIQQVPFIKLTTSAIPPILAGRPALCADLG